MKNLRLRILLIGAFLMAACSAAPETYVDLGPAPAYQEKNSIAEIIDYENDMPEWVSRYNSAGLAGIEALPEYAGRHIFVSRQIGHSLEPLQLWAAGFSTERDAPRLVSARIQERFVADSGGNPGDTYGRYFEAVVKNASNAGFQEASREGSFWIKKRIYEDDGISPAGEIYEYLIMISIDKETLRQQISMMLITTRPDKPLTKEQSAASMRLRLNFFEGF
jgi:hypothetical protein